MNTISYEKNNNAFWPHIHIVFKLFDSFDYFIAGMSRILGKYEGQDDSWRSQDGLRCHVQM